MDLVQLHLPWVKSKTKMPPRLIVCIDSTHPENVKRAPQRPLSIAVEYGTSPARGGLLGLYARCLGYSTLITLRVATSAFGKVISSTPCSNVAFAFSLTTVVGSRTGRAKVP
jgi:hypothetical protein